MSPSRRARTDATGRARVARPALLMIAAPALLLCAAAGAAEPTSGAAPAPPDSKETGPPDTARPADGNQVPAIRVGAARIEQSGPRRYTFSGDVDIRHGNLRLQADEVEYDDASRQCRARGHVVLEEGASRLTGEQIDINLDTRLASIRNAHAEMEPDLIVDAKRLEKLSETRFRIFGATVTSCTQPIPYWSFRVGRGTIHLDRYAHLSNLSFRVAGVPVFYTPYLLWPVKEDRASGLLIPQLGYSQRRGMVVNAAYFWAPARNFDSTFYLDYLEKDGTGRGLESRWLPNADGRVRFTGYALQERIEDPTTGAREGERYRFHLDADQKLPGSWRFLADLNQVSDFDYYLDFERDLRAATSSSVLSTLDLTRSWSHYTLNLRGERREQILSPGETLLQQRRPEIEFRGRSRRLGKSPIHFSFESSATALEREVSYGRLDLFPKFRAPFRPAPWIEITPAVSYRETVWTRQRDLTGTEPARDDALRRGLLRGELDLLGPRFSRVHETPGWGFTPRVKGVIEPRLTWTYVPEEKDVRSGGTSRILLFDEIDSQADNLNSATYSVTWRWFALRPAGPGPAGLTLPRRIPLPGLAPEPQTAAEAAAARTAAAQAPQAEQPADPRAATAPQTAPAPPPLNPVEFLSFALSQAYGFDAPQSVLGTDTSNFSPISATLRVNPTAHHSLNLNASYNVLRRTVERTTLSADLRARDHLLSLTWFLGNNITDDQSQLRLYAGTAMFRRKVTLAVETKVDLAASEVQDQRYRIGYNTQCCGFLAEYLDRDFNETQEREYRFLINLKGVGTLFDLQQDIH